MAARVGALADDLQTTVAEAEQGGKHILVLEVRFLILISAKDRLASQFLFVSAHRFLFDSIVALGGWYRSKA